jgi:hypothetical protein
MERELAKTAEDIVCEKGNEVGFGCYCTIAAHNQSLGATRYSPSPVPHSRPYHMPLLTRSRPHYVPLLPHYRPHHMPLLPHARPHHCCLAIAASLCIVSLPLSHYRCLTTAVSLPLSYYHCLTTAVSLPLSHYRCLTIAASVFIVLLPLSHCLLPAATAKKPRSTTTPSVSPHTCT